MIVKKILDNGLTLVTESMPHVRSVAVGVWLRRGSRHESPELSGISHFIEHMVFKGTERRSAARIAEEMDAIGGQTDAFTTKEYASFYAQVLDEHLPLVMDLLADILLNPRFDREEMERERKVIFEEFKMVEDTPDDLAHELFQEKFWPNHPLGRPILGWRKTVKALTREDLVAFFRSTYIPANLIVAAAGNLDPGRVEDLVGRHFGPLRPHPNGFHSDSPFARPGIRVKRKKLEQVHLVLGTPAPAQAHADRYTIYVLNTILGGNMSSRLFQNIREKQGLAYNVFSSLSSYSDAGVLTVYAATSPANAARVAALVVQELRRLRAEPIGADELQRAKEHLKGSILLGLEGTVSRMSNLARQEMIFGRHISLDEFLSGFDGVSRESVHRLAGEMLNGKRIGLTAVGQLDHFKPEREQLIC
jgi:predicted Zn-dependent peptidase